MSQQKLKLDQIDAAGATDGQALVWDDSIGAWAPKAVGGEANPTLVTLTRTAGGLTSMTETVDGDPRVTTFTRDAGLLTQTITTYRGKTVTNIFNRTDGRLTGVTTTEA